MAIKIIYSCDWCGENCAPAFGNGPRFENFDAIGRIHHDGRDVTFAVHVQPINSERLHACNQCTITMLNSIIDNLSDTSSEVQP